MDIGTGAGLAGSVGVRPFLPPLLTGARVLISHDAEQGLAEADRVLGLRGGRQVLWAEAAAVSREDVRSLYA